jgi:hypothetical protein
LNPFKRLEKLAILDGRPFPTLDWPDDSDTTTKQVEVVRAALSNASLHLSEVCLEWVYTGFFSFRAAEVGQIWGSHTILRLGLLVNEDLGGVVDLKLVLRGLSNLKQLHLSTLEDGHMLLDRFVDQSKAAWHHLTDLTLRGFVAREPNLQGLLTLPRLRSIKSFPSQPGW